MSTKLVSIYFFFFLFSAAPSIEQNINTSHLKIDSTIVEGEVKKIIIEGDKTMKIVYLDSTTIVGYALLCFSIICLSIYIIYFFRSKRKYQSQKINSLSERELLVAQLVKQGKMNKEIADQLNVSLSTVKTHINNLYKKLEIKDRKMLKNIPIKDN